MKYYFNANVCTIYYKANDKLAKQKTTIMRNLKKKLFIFCRFKLIRDTEYCMYYILTSHLRENMLIFC